jgi:multidrug resistance efflux pump
MIACLTIIYASVVTILFNFKLVKPRPYPIACAVVAGLLIIGGVVVAWMLCAPVSPQVVTWQYVVQLVPYVKGQVKKVHALANQEVKKGDLLLEIDSAPYQYTVNQLEASLKASQETVNQYQAGLEVAQANILKAKDGVAQARAALEQSKAGVASAQAILKKAKAQDELAKTEEQIALNTQKADPGAISALRIAQAVQNRQLADAAVIQVEAEVAQAQAAQRQSDASLSGSQSAQQQAEASARQATFSLKVAMSNLPAITAQLEDARFNLAQCRILAPADGYVENWQVQDGTMLVPMPMAAAGTFICSADTAIVAAFPQNYLANVNPGDDVELVLDPYPGRLFQGKVDTVIEATGEGQYKVGGDIPTAAKIGSYGMLAVKVRLTGEDSATKVPLGAGGTVAIYTDRGKPVHIISKVTIRMKKWLLYVVPSVNMP